MVTNMLFPVEYSPDQSWVDQDCDIRESVYGWDRAPCSACTISNLVTKNIEARAHLVFPKIQYFDFKRQTMFCPTSLSCEDSATGLGLTRPSWS